MEIVLKPCDLRAPTAEEHILAYHGVTFIRYMTREELEREFPEPPA